MARPSWHLDRRTFLRGAGLSLALPWLEAMAKADPAAEPPKRFCAFFFGNGVAIPKQDSSASEEGWSWFPRAGGSDFTLTKPLEPLAPYRHDMSIFGGMSHPSSRLLVGHNTVDVWLTGADIRLSLQNSISLDQLIARHAGAHTRIPSLVLSSHGGVGTKSRSTTISFDDQGRALGLRHHCSRSRTRATRPGKDVIWPNLSSVEVPDIPHQDKGLIQPIFRNDLERQPTCDSLEGGFKVFVALKY